MDLQVLPDDEDTVRRFVEELWLPYHRTLEATVEGHALAEDVDLVAEEVAFRLDRAGDDDRRTWVAVDAGDGPVDSEPRSVDFALPDVELAGFVATEIDRSPSVLERPDRLIVADVFVREPYRGTVLGRDLIHRAAEHARETGCAELALDVAVDNERALAFYDALGFETRRLRLAVDVDEL